ncbi:MAG: ribonuclease III domain-containing protein [Bacilli bacterium]|nr:ribonuclease III domain-containing protein [Bacilli bacterium]
MKNVEDVRLINVIALAYLGDAIYEVYIRESLIRLGIVRVEELQKKAVFYVSAKGQASILKRLLDENKLTSEEIDIVKRGRNYKRSSHPKHTDILTYKLSTGFETLIGYLYLSKNEERLAEIFDYIEVK